MSSNLWAVLAIGAFAALVVCTLVAFVFVKRRLGRPSLAVAAEVGSVAAVLRKVRRRESMTADELQLARRVISDSRSPMVWAIPAGVFALGCLFVFGSLDQLHGATPSERTFLGVFPMLTATNLSFWLLRNASLNRRFQKRFATPPKARVISTKATRSYQLIS